jgi:hypothetical protein
MNAKIKSLVHLFDPETRKIAAWVYFEEDIPRDLEFWLELGKANESIKSSRTK